MQTISKKSILGIVGTAVAVILLALSFSVFEDADKSYNYVCQMPITGEYHVWTDGGLQVQMFGHVESYQKTTQVEFSGIEKNHEGYVSVGKNPAAATTFNDKGRGMVIGSFRVVLPLDASHMEKIQQDFGSEDALIETLVRPTLYKVVTACGPLMSSLESVSETRTDLTAYITDQLNDGIYKTRIVKTEVVNELTGEAETRNKAVIIEDINSPGGYARQEVSPFSKYGITCGLVSIIDIKYDKATQDQIDAQKDANLAVITSKTQAIQAQQKTIQIMEEGKAAAEKAKWEQEREKAVAVTKAEQEKEVARLAAEKAEYNKKRVIAEGEAEAAANRAKVAAGLTPQEKEEYAIRKIDVATKNLAQTNFPKFIITGSNGGHQSPLDVIALERWYSFAEKLAK